MHKIDNQKVFNLTFKKKPIKIEVGNLALQTESSVFIEYEDCTILTTIVIGEKKNVDFLPLNIIVNDKMYAYGKIPSGFFKRETRTTEFSILLSRLIDRSLRPIFDQNIRNEIQITINILSVSLNWLNLEMISVLSSSIALNLIKNLNFNPVSLLKIKENPLTETELYICANNSGIHMLEGFFNEIKEENLLEIINQSWKDLKTDLIFQKKVIEKCDSFWFDFLEKSISEEKIINFWKKLIKEELSKQNFLIDEIIKEKTKKKQDLMLKNLFLKIIDLNQEKINSLIQQEKEKYLILLENEFNHWLKKYLRKKIINSNSHIDGRKIDEIRKLNIKIDVLNHVHGSSLFQRGFTQVLTIATLSDLDDYQSVEGWNKEKKYFFHHYNFNSFSVNSLSNKSFPSRREIGHGYLVEKTFKYLLPNLISFPYTIRLVSEVLSSDGSTSQASICASSLALMASGVPLKKHVAGISIGAIFDEDKEIIFTDIQGIEDYCGDVDFKIAGTAGTTTGIFSLQMDVKKIFPFSFSFFEKIFTKAKNARILIINEMNKILNSSKNMLSENALKNIQIPILTKEIGKIIGPNGKIINDIIKNTNQSKIKINDDGKIIIYNQNNIMLKKAYNLIKSILTPIAIKNKFLGKIVKFNDEKITIVLKEGYQGLIKSDLSLIKNNFKINDYIWVEIIKLNEQFIFLKYLQEDNY
jgi:polyribonucleotide nucleotidyltransferase